MFRKNKDAFVKACWHKRIEKLEEICLSTELCSSNDEGSKHVYLSFYKRELTLKKRMDRIEEKLDNLMAYLKLEIHTPDCALVIRKKVEDKGVTND